MIAFPPAPFCPSTHRLPAPPPPTLTNLPNFPTDEGETSASCDTTLFAESTNPWQIITPRCHPGPTTAGLARLAGGQHFYKTSGSLGDVADALSNPRGLGLRLKEAALMGDLADGKVLAKALIVKKANVNVRAFVR